MQRFIVLLTGALLLSACEGSPPSNTSRKKATPPPVEQAPETMDRGTAQDAGRAADARAWPFNLRSGMQDAEHITADPDAFLKKNYLVIFDGSGSMKETGCSAGKPKIDVAKAAVTRWADSVDADANLGLVAFYGATFATLPLGSSRQQFNEQVEAVAAGGKTPLGRSIEAAYAMLTKQAFRQNGYGEYSIVVVTDGAASDENDMNRWVAAILRDSPIQITTIGFCIGDDHSLNQPGRTIYKAANNPEELAKGLEAVLAEAEQFDLSEFK